MKTLLYQDSLTKDIKTFEELKTDYTEKNNSDLPISDDVMQLIIFENLVQNGGKYILINDDKLSWCNEYSEYLEGNRFLSQTERDGSIRDIYYYISENDISFLKDTKNILATDEKSRDLIGRLEKLMK